MIVIVREWSLMSFGALAVALGTALVLLGASTGQAQVPADELPFAATFITAGQLSATAVEGRFSGLESRDLGSMWGVAPFLLANKGRMKDDSFLIAAPAAGAEPPAEDLPFEATLITEGTLPATEIEGGFSFAKSDTDRTTQFGFSSLQYAWGRTFGLKLSIPFGVINPRDDDEPTVAGIGDVTLMGKYVPLISYKHLFAVGTGVKFTLPTGSESRGLGGTAGVAPFLLAGKIWKNEDKFVIVQADAFYDWQLNKPATEEPDDPADEPVSPDREQRFTANATATFSILSWLNGIVELNSALVTAGGDSAVRNRMQLYVTPGLSTKPAEGWDIRAGVQLPITSAKEFDYNIVFLVTKGF
jgi:hypothetical protein